MNRFVLEILLYLVKNLISILYFFLFSFNKYKTIIWKYLITNKLKLSNISFKRRSYSKTSLSKDLAKLELEKKWNNKI